MSSALKRILFVAALVALSLATIVFIEGLASFAFFARTAFSSLSESRHTERDTLLGWINMPGVSRPDMYGRGASLHTNAQRFRGAKDLTAAPAPGRVRVICSGDSFTLGYGVDDSETWCARLEHDDSRLEAVNMGQGGYGVDQAYLWYLRDGIQWRPAVHLFAFVGWDVTRMASNRFLGYPKPVLVRSGDTVRVEGIPVPSPGLAPRMVAIARGVQELKTFKIFNRIAGGRSDLNGSPDTATWRIARAAIEHVVRRDVAAGIKPVVVYLPTSDDFAGSGVSSYRGLVRAAASEGAFELVDLVEPARNTFADSISSFFLFGNGHYTPLGNAWVARQLKEQIPELRPR